MSNPFVLTIPAMTCGHCVRAIQSTLADHHPAGAEVDLKAKQITVDAAPGALEGILKALADAGYTATSVRRVQAS